MVAAVYIFLVRSWVLDVPWHVCCQRPGGLFRCSRCNWLWCLFSRSVALPCLVNGAGHTLCLFVSFLADSIQHSSIKVYLSAVRSLHIEQGFPDPLVNCLRLQRVLRGVKRSQGSPAARRLPITDSLHLVIHRALDLTNFDHCAFWAACMLGYFGFLRAAEFTVPNLASFSPAIYLTVADIAMDSLQSPACLRVQIKASKTDPFTAPFLLQVCCLFDTTASAWCLGLLESEVLFHPSFFKGHSQGCHGHLLMLEHCQLHQRFRHQHPSSSIGDEFNPF